jgi:hypothetical protein
MTCRRRVAAHRRMLATVLLTVLGAAPVALAQQADPRDQFAPNPQVATEVEQQRFELDALKREVLRQSEVIELLTQRLEQNQQNAQPAPDGPDNKDGGRQQPGGTCVVPTYRAASLPPLSSPRSSQR